MESDTIELQVKTVCGQKHSVRVAPTATVLQLKEQIATATSIPLNDQRLIHVGKVMADDKTIDFYKLTEGKTVHVVKRPPPQLSQQSQSASTPASSQAPNGSAQARGGMPLPAQWAHQQMPDGQRVMTSTITIPMAANAGQPQNGQIQVGVSQVWHPAELIAYLYLLWPGFTSSPYSTHICLELIGRFTTSDRPEHYSVSSLWGAGISRLTGCCAQWASSPQHSWWAVYARSCECASSARSQ